MWFEIVEIFLPKFNFHSNYLNIDTLKSVVNLKKRKEKQLRDKIWQLATI